MFDMKNQRLGVEVEMTGISRRNAARIIKEVIDGSLIDIGDSYDTYKITDTYHRTWKIVLDGSIETEGRNGEAVELVSPILTYDKCKTLTKIIVALKEAGAVVNNSCGIHVHVDAANHNVKSLKNLLKMFSKRESLMTSFLEIDADRVNGFCRFVDNHIIENLDRVKDMNGLANLWYHDCNNVEYEQRRHYSSTRYYMLNLHNVWFRGTVEFRMFNSTLEIEKIMSYIQFVLAMSARAINLKDVKKAKYNFKTEKEILSTWLSGLGLKGAEFKVCRKLFLASVTA